MGTVCISVCVYQYFIRRRMEAQISGIPENRSFQCRMKPDVHVWATQELGRRRE